MTNAHIILGKKLALLVGGHCVALVFLASALSSMPANSTDHAAEAGHERAQWLGLTVETKTGRSIGYVTGTRFDDDGALQMLVVDNQSAGRTISEPTLVVDSQLVERTENSIVLNLRMVDG